MIPPFFHHNDRFTGLNYICNTSLLPGDRAKVRSSCRRARRKGKNGGEIGHNIFPILILRQETYFPSFFYRACPSSFLPCCSYRSSVDWRATSARWWRPESAPFRRTLSPCPWTGSSRWVHTNKSNRFMTRSLHRPHVFVSSPQKHGNPKKMCTFDFQKKAIRIYPCLCGVGRHRLFAGGCLFPRVHARIATTVRRKRFAQGGPPVVMRICVYVGCELSVIHRL